MKKNKVEKKRSLFAKIFIVIAILLLGILIAIFFITDWYNTSIYSTSETHSEVEFRVNTGDSLVNIADTLEEKGLIKSKDALRLYLRLNNLSPNIKAGDYLLNTNQSVPQLIEIFEAGAFKPSVWVTIKEGLKNESIGEILNSSLIEGGERKKFDYDEFINLVENPGQATFSEEVTNFLKDNKPNDKPLTGYLFPDTYRINSDADAKEVIEILVMNLKTRLDENSIQTDSIFWDTSIVRNFYEALTLASILEKESGRDDDIKMVSGVFYNRLSENYPLQSDATVNFATGKNERGASFKDLEIDSPYNTYKYAGLPPTPINNPGIRSIDAAVEPKETNYYFFWHSSQNKIYFAVTYDEHQRNIRNYP